jgi:hypothetical protein
MTLKGLSPNAQALNAKDHPINAIAGRASRCSLILVSNMRLCRTDAPPASVCAAILPRMGAVHVSPMGMSI